jgi:signal transduction histidine kinase
MMGADPVSPRGGGHGDKANILIVDDLPEKLLAFRTMLEELGENLVMARSGSEALAEVLKREFAVILLDLNMPDIDGLETAALIRDYKRSAHTPIIFITAYADEMQAHKAYQLGAVDYILSPIQPDVLRSKVKVFVELFQLQRRTREMAEERVALARAETARRAAEESNRRKDEFIAMLSHELRNPLAPIRAGIEVIRRMKAAEPTVAQAVEVMDRQVVHLVRLVEELLEVSRISQGRITLKKEPVELSKVITLGVETARPLISSRNQALDIVVPPTPVWVSGDGMRLSQVVANLLNNAAKYTQERGRIEIVATASAGEAVILVRDNGTGIDSQLLPHVFDLFVQGERSLDRSQGGLGIGLSLVRHLVELHQGRVEAHSAGAGKGATFKVVLPCINAVSAEPPIAVVPQAGQKAERVCRIMVVDDNIDAAESVAMYLRLEGHEVKVVTDAHHAISSATVFAPQVAVLDIGLPELDGYYLARRLRQQQSGGELTLIALTGYGQKEDRERALEAGFDHFFVKPTDPREIQAAISRGTASGGTRAKPEASGRVGVS